MSSTNSDATELGRILSLLRYAEKETSDTEKNIKKMYRQLGQDWSDKHYKELQLIVNDCCKALNTIGTLMQQTDKYVGSLITYVKEYDSVFGGGHRGAPVMSVNSANGEAWECNSQMIPDTNDGPRIKVLKLGGSSGRAHHDYQKELADLDTGIQNAESFYNDVAHEIMQNIANIEKDGTLTTPEKIERLRQNEARLHKLERQRANDRSEWETERNRLLGLIGARYFDGNSITITALFGLISLGMKNTAMGIITVTISMMASALLWVWTKVCKVFLIWSMRQNEFIADEYAMKLGFGYELATVIDKHMCGIPRKGLFNALYNTHPYHDDRIAALQKLGVNYSRYEYNY